MIKRKKTKLKKWKFLSLILFVCGIISIIAPYFLVSIYIYGDDIITLDYGEKYSEPGYRGDILDKDITNDIEVTSNIENEIGTYQITYTYKSLIYYKKAVRYVEVKDLSGPQIILEGDNNIEVTIDTEYQELGYRAVDNVDGDVTSEVIVKNNIDITKLGNYTVDYEVSDSFGNKTTTQRNVKVERMRPTQLGIKEYTLDGWYDDTKLALTQNMGDDYYNSFKIVGDSNIMYLYGLGYIKSGNAWAVPCLHAESMFSTEINIYGYNLKMKLLDAVKKYNPSRIILYFGSFSTSWIDEEVFKSNANEIINQIKIINPDIKIILMSIYPIEKRLDNVMFSQDKINKYNFYILEMAHNHDLKFLDVQSVLKGDDGYVASKYISHDGYHLSGNGHSLVKQYIKTHAIKED